MKIAVAFVILAAAFGLTSCSSSSASSNPNGRPRVLRYAFTSMSEDADSAAKRLDSIKGYLSKTLKMDVEVYRTANSYSSVIEAFRANKIDMAGISPFSYVIATQTIPIEAIVMRGNPEGEPGEYTGSLLVPSDSPLHTMEDVRKHSKELVISFVDPASTSGYLVQQAYFQSIGMDPERDFKRVTFSMTHPASIMALKSHKVDVTATGEKMIKRYMQAGKISPSDYRVIWTSPDVPNQPLAVRKNLPAEFKEELRQAFLKMPNDAPEVYRNMYPKIYTLPAGQVYVPANDGLFDGLRAMARNVKNLNLLER